MSDLEFWIWSFIFLSMLFSGGFFVAFGQITVKRLRKTPEIKDLLGFEYVSGMDIANVAAMLCLPRSWARFLDKSRAAFLVVNSEAIYKNTTRFDRVLGRAHFLFSLLTVFLLFTAMAAEHFGLFE